ncbi:uncharacterized protein V6R79_000814 [Siganus canaliculatus]
MMSSQSMQPLIGPVFQRKIPLFDGSVASQELSKPQNMCDFLGKQALQYSGAYFTYDPRGKDRAQVPPPWSYSKTLQLDGRSPVSHFSGIEGPNRVIHRKDSTSSEEGQPHPHSSSVHHAPVKQGFTAYTKSPRISSPTAATSAAVKKTKNGSERLSPPSENPVYFAFPKPVYGHNPCCTELGCVIGQHYSMEHSPARISNAMYEHDWAQTDAHYSERPPVRRKTQDTLLQHRGLQFEPRAEPLKRIPLEPYSPGRARTLPGLIDPNYSSYPCTLTRTLFGPLSEQSQRLQTSPRGYPSLYPSPPTYENMTSEVYPEHSPISKYGQRMEHPMFYCPQANVELEKRTHCKDNGGKQQDGVPVLLKHTISNPRDHYVVPQLLQGEIPLHLASAEALPNHSLLRGFDYSCFAVPGFHFNIRPPLKRHHPSTSLHPHHVSVSPSSPYMEHPMASPTSLNKEKPSARLHVDQSHSNSPFRHVDQNPPRRASQPGISPTSMQRNGFFPPLTSLHIDGPVFSPTGLSPARLQDSPPCKVHGGCPKQQGLPVSPAAWLPQSPRHNSGQPDTAIRNNANTRKIIYSPSVPSEKKEIGVSNPEGRLKRSISSSASPIRIKEEKRDLCEVKRQKLKTEEEAESPPMPVIDSVFSLAPYQQYLKASGVLFTGRAPQRLVQSPERHEVEPQPDKRERGQHGDEKQPEVPQLSPQISTKAPTEKPVTETFHPKNIKVEKDDKPDTDNSAETPVNQMDYSNVVVKKEPEDTDSPDTGHMLVIKKCEPDELESKPMLKNENDKSDVPKPDEVAARTNSSLQHDEHKSDKADSHEAVLAQPATVTPPQPAESKRDFRNIPPQCLKLSTYKIVLRDIQPPSVAPPPETPPVQPMTDCAPNLKLQMPIRKHFFELHHCLYKLVSKTVQASSEQDLRSWITQLELTEPVSPSAKVQKVSSLLGLKAREVWLNEEIKSALQKLLERLREYTAQERCPFPHVMRTGAVFVPMLVVKELLFPTVQGSFIDQVLQEHKVELRPTTLSEEKILIQLHKRACSSRLRRLMSLKHLPNIYADVVNLLYYTCVCKHLGLNKDDPATREKDDSCEETIRRTDASASPTQSCPPTHEADQEQKCHLNRSRTKSRVKRSSRRMFLDDTLSDEDKTGDTVTRNWTDRQSERSGSKDDAGEDSLLIQQSTSAENSWMCPLSWDDLSPSASEPETEQLSSHSSGKVTSPVRPNNCSSVILKLRRMFNKGLSRKKAHYQAVSDSGAFVDPSLRQTDNKEGEASGDVDMCRRTNKATHRWQRTGNFSHTLRPLNSSSKRKCRSLLKIKYCPYLSACHSAEHRRRWVLRSAVRRAQRAMRLYYPDLVGKRIRHLYEEDDKSEVWYRGEVLRVHEAHTNPLKTIFEVRYDSEPEWKYYLELLIDYKKGWLEIEA